MKDYRKTKAQLLDELAELRQEIAHLKAVEAECVELKQQLAASVPMGKVPQQDNVIDPKSTEEAIRESDERYRDLYEEAPISYYSVGVDGLIRRVNKHMAKMLGYSRDALIGKQVLDLYADTPEGKGKVKELLPKFQTGDEVHAELEMRRVDGMSIWIDLSMRPIFDEKGHVIESRAAAVDITERKRAEAERERLLAEIEAAYRRYVRKEWGQFLNEQHQGHWIIEYSQIDRQSISASETLAPIQDEMASTGKVQAVSGNGDNERQAEPTIVVPISLRGQVIGTLGLQDVDPNRQWTSEELGLIETVTEQLALTIENLRLFDDSQHRATREQLTRKITDRMRASPDADSIIQTGITELANVLGVSRTYVKLVSMPVEEDEETDA